MEGTHPGPTGPDGEREVMRELAELGVHYYPPSMLIRRAQKIGLTADQVVKIRQEMLSTQAHTVDLMAKVGHAKIEATRLLTADKVDEHAVDAQIDEGAKALAEMHKLRLGMALRVRALLTAEQRQKLEERKKGKREGPKPAAGSPGQPPAAGAADDDDDDEDDDAQG
jgi:Spy/CpxP family protein refolding chaperone